VLGRLLAGVHAWTACKERRRGPVYFVVSRLEPSYVVFGTSPWSDPWLTEQNLAYALSKRHRVLYVEPPMTPLTPLRYPGRGRQLGYALARSLRWDRGVAIYQPLVLPPRSHPVAARLSAPILAGEVGRVVARLGLSRPVVISGDATPGLLGAAGERLSIYLVKDWVDGDGHLLGRDSSQLAAERDAMCERADLICAISRTLQETLARRGFEAELLEHGFHSDVADRYDADEPAEYAGLPRPLLGFAGRIDGRLDLGLLEALADRFRSGSILLIGPVVPRIDQAALRRLTDRHNVHLLGSFGRDELPPYLAHLDCALIPYFDSQWARHGSPLKLWDYLYAGPPVVGSGYSILRDYEPDFVRFASDTEGFIDAVERSLDDPPERREHRRAFAARNTWDARAGDLEAIVAKAIDRQDRSALRVAVFPHADFANPYQRLLHEALRSHEVEVLPTVPLRLRWARRAGAGVDVVHLHWLEWLISDSRKRGVSGALNAYARAARLLLFLRILRRSGVRIVWTVHNLRPHEPRFSRLENAVSRRVARVADELVVHSEYAAGKVRAEFHLDRPIRVARHGNYSSFYPPERRGREAVRAELGLPENGFVYLLFGCIRTYKQTPAAIEAFSRLGDPDSRLIVAGAPDDPDMDAVKAAAARDDRVLLHLGMVPDEKVAAYHLASDAAVFNYRDVFSSGALLLALSFGVPVVAPGNSMADEIAAPPALVSFTPGTLTDALEAIATGDQNARRQAALRTAAAYPWSRTVQELLPAYGIDPSSNGIKLRAVAERPPSREAAYRDVV
jgi:beta-1,4-mannosyltransferase